MNCMEDLHTTTQDMDSKGKEPANSAETPMEDRPSKSKWDTDMEHIHQPMN